MGNDFIGSEFIDCTGNREEKIIIDEEGNGEFYCNDGSVSIWKKNSPKNN